MANNRRGSSILYVVVILFLIIGISIMYNKYKITHLNERTKTVNTSNVESFLNDLETQLVEGTPIKSTNETAISENLSGKTYTAKITPPAEFEQKEVTDIYSFNRQGTLVKDMDFDSNFNKQVLTFVENKLTNKTSKHLLSSNLFNNNTVYSDTGSEVILETDAKYKKLAYRKNGSVLEYKDDYPSNTTLGLNSPVAGDIYHIYYLSDTGETLKWQRFMYGKMQEYKEEENTFMFIQTPNRDLKIKEDIVYNFPSYNYLSLNTNLTESSELNRKLMNTDLLVNILTNVTGEYQLDIDYDTYDSSLPVNHESSYLEGSDTFTLYSGTSASNRIEINQSVSSNYVYTDKDNIAISDVSKNSQVRQLSVKTSNMIISKVSLTYKQLVSGTYKLTITDANGKVVREKQIVIGQ